MKKIKAFTLVELIVVITILAILATIGFVSFSGYLAGTRDTNRVAQLKSMSDALELYRTKKDLPIPDDKVYVKADGTVIAYQGDIGKNVLETIEYTESGLDPKYKEYFSYYLTKNKKYFQLMAFLEELDTDVVESTNAIDYSNKYTKTTGKKLGILTNENNTPIQKVEVVTNSGYLDIVNTNVIYKQYFTGEHILSGTGKTLRGAPGIGGLVGYWNFEEIDGTTFIDYSENSASGTISGGVTLQSGQVGNAAYFDGNDGEFYVDLIKNIGGNSSAPHTISTWIKPDSIPTCSDDSCRQWILFLGNEPGSGTHHWLLNSNNKNQFGIRSGIQKQPSLIAGEWQNIVIVFDGEKLYGYINGHKILKNSSEKKITEMNIKNSKLHLGHIIDSHYKGYIDELKIFNRALKQKEVELLYNIDK